MVAGGPPWQAESWNSPLLIQEWQHPMNTPSPMALPTCLALPTPSHHCSPMLLGAGVEEQGTEVWFSGQPSRERLMC